MKKFLSLVGILLFSTGLYSEKITKTTTHDTAPKYAGQDKVNPSSLILSGEMMLRFFGWTEAADTLISALEKTISNKTVTYDLERQLEGATLLKCSEFGHAVANNM